MTVYHDYAYFLLLIWWFVKSLQLRLVGFVAFKRIVPWRGSPACGRPHWSKVDSFCSPIGRLEWVVMHLKLQRQLGKTVHYLIEKTEHIWKMLQRKWKERERERERGRRRERGCVVIVTLKVWFDKLQCGERLLNNICTRTHTLIHEHSKKTVYIKTFSFQILFIGFVQIGIKKQFLCVCVWVYVYEYVSESNQISCLSNFKYFYSYVPKCAILSEYNLWTKNGHFKCQSHSHVLFKQAVIYKNKLQNRPEFMPQFKSQENLVKFSIWNQWNTKKAPQKTFWDFFTTYLKSSIHHRRQYPLRAGLMLGWLIVLCRLSFPWFVSIVCGRTTDCSQRWYFSEKV